MAGAALAAGFLMLITDSEPALAAFPGENGKIAFYSQRDGNNLEVYTMNADGSGQTNLTKNPAFDLRPVFSPNGTKIAFESNRSGNDEIWMMNADGSAPENLTNNPGSDAGATFSPDGTKIVFMSYRGDDFEIYVMNADGSGVGRLTNSPIDDTAPSWSPDSTKIAFQSYRDGNFEIYVMNGDGTNQTNFTNSPGVDWEPTFSPDGTKLAFASDGNHQGSAPDIYVSNLDGSGKTQLTTDLAMDDIPDWQRLPDATKPTITLTTPANGATYKLGTIVNASYECADEARGSGLESCTGTVPKGSPINTSTVGTKSFTVTATDKVGNTDTVTHTYKVTKNGKPPSSGGGGKGGGPKPK